MIVIVGGGLTGLALAHQLRMRGVDHVVLESSARAGGVIRSGRVDGHLLDWGPQRTRLTAGIRELIEDLRLEEEMITAPAGLPLYVYTRGKLRVVPFSARAFFESDLLTFRGRARSMLEPLTAGPRSGESVADYFTRKIGQEAYESMVGPLYGGLYASDPKDMVVDLSLGRVLREFGIGRSLILPLLRRGGRIDPPPALSFRGGMQRLPDALLRFNRDRVRLSEPAQAIRSSADGLVVDTPEESIPASHVVLTAPAPDSARLLQSVAPEASRRIDELVYNPLAVVHLSARTDLHGLGYQVSFAENLKTRGVTFNDSLFGREGVYTAYLGGARSPEVIDLPDDEISRLAVTEFNTVTGFEAEPISVAREWMPAWDRSWRALQSLELPPGIRLAANWESRPGIPGRLAQAARLADELSRT